MRENNGLFLFAEHVVRSWILVFTVALLPFFRGDTFANMHQEKKEVQGNKLAKYPCLRVRNL
jgi:hypothetical protein